jgi:sugar phosphate permease
MHEASSPAAILARTRRLRWTAFALVGAAYVLSFFHRIAPAAIAGELRAAFGASGAELGALAATYFSVYTVMQVPTGVLVDTLGPRRIVAVGGFVAGIGSVAFGLAGRLGVASLGRALVGLGVSVTFVALLKLVAAWFREREFATVSGLTMFLGNVGAVLSAAPLAWAVSFTSWRGVFAALGVVSVLLGALTWILVRDHPGEAGLPSVREQDGQAAHPPRRGHWLDDLRRVARNRATWPGFFVNLGLGGSYLAFAGLWSVPYLTDAHGMSRTLATTHTTTMLVVFALSSLAAGSLSDRMGRRRPLLVALGAVHVLCWIPLLWAFPGSRAGSIALFAAIGASATAFTLSWASAKEVNPPALSGMAMSIVNTGVFLGPTLTQPLVGWVIERGVAGGAGGGRGGAADYRLGLGVLAAFSLVGLASALFVRETFCRNVTVDPSPEGAAGDR